MREENSYAITFLHSESLEAVVKVEGSISIWERKTFFLEMPLLDRVRMVCVLREEVAEERGGKETDGISEGEDEGTGTIGEEDKGVGDTVVDKGQESGEIEEG